MNRFGGGIAIVMAGIQLALTGCERKDPAEAWAGKEFVLAQTDYDLPAGVTFEIRQNGGMVDIPVEIKGRGKRLEGSMTSSGEKELRAKMISENEATIVVIRNRQKNGFEVKDAPASNQEVVSPLEGKTIAFRLEDGGWVAKAVNGEAVADELVGLTANYTNFLRGDDLKVYGSEPRMVGDEWTLDSDIPSDLLGLGEIQGGTIKLKFAGIRNHTGLECAVLEGKVDVVVETELPGGGIMSMNLRGDLKTYRSLEYLRDLSTELTGDLEIGGALDNGMTIGGRGAFKASRSATLVIPELPGPR